MRTDLRGISQAAVLLTLIGASQMLCVPADVHAAPSGLNASVQTENVPTLQELEHGIADRLKRVEEFKFIEQEAAKLGVRAWLFGGTAAGYAHYVKWDMQREKGDPRFQPDRFDYDYTSIFRSTQDLDIVIDGNPEQAQKLQAALQEKYPHLQGNKTAWEVRLLTQDMGDKQAILNNPDFMNQHTDSNSTGMVEITQPRAGESVVRDVRDWNAKQPHFLKDVHDGALHYYFSPSHFTTKFAKEGRNPPILSAIRYLTKAFQYELELRPDDLEQIKKIIGAFDPRQASSDPYVAKWIEKNGKKLFQNAVNLEYAWNTLEQLGLRKKLQDISGNVGSVDSLAWWMNKEPLRSQALGQGSGKTAKDLGLDIVAHETNNFLAYESITRAHTGDPNVLISRENAAGEAAVHGNGFYTKLGREGARGTGLTIRFHLDPRAKEGTDFKVVQNGAETYVVLKNRAALRVIPESLNLSAVDYFKMLEQEDSGVDHADLGILEKLKRKLGTKINALNEAQMQEILGIVRGHIERVKNGTAKRLPNPFNEHVSAVGTTLLLEWFRSPASARHPELLHSLIQFGTLDLFVIRSILSQPQWIGHPEFIEELLQKNDPKLDKEIAERILSLPGSEKRPEWVEKILQRGTANEPIAAYVLSKPHWKGHPEWVEALLKNKDTRLVSVFITNSLTKSHWANHPKWPEWISNVVREGKYDRALTYILNVPESKNHFEWMNTVLQRGQVDAFLGEALASPNWQDHPEIFEVLIKRRDLAEGLIQRALLEPHWKNHPELRRLMGGTDPTVSGLRDAFHRGETLMPAAKASSACVTQNLKDNLLSK
jgi:hypothetical protein